jgi:hypothetical protein
MIGLIVGGTAVVFGLIALYLYCKFKRAEESRDTDTEMAPVEPDVYRVFGLIAGKRIWAGFFIVCLYMYCRWRSSYQKEGRIVIPLTGITPPHVCACSKPGHGFSTTYHIRRNAQLLLVKDVFSCYYYILDCQGGQLDLFLV